jgi:hypothetical protein
VGEAESRSVRQVRDRITIAIPWQAGGRVDERVERLVRAEEGLGPERIVKLVVHDSLEPAAAPGELAALSAHASHQGEEDTDARNPLP